MSLRNSKVQSTPYAITRDLVKFGYRHTLTLYGAKLAVETTKNPHPSDWMLDRQMKGNIAALQGNLADSVQRRTITVQKTLPDGDDGKCHVPTPE